MLTVALQETVRVQNGRAPLLVKHLVRLRAGGCEDDTLARINQAVLQQAAAWQEPYGRLGLRVDTDGRVDVDVSSRSSSIDILGGPVAMLVETDVPTLPPGGAKPANRDFWDAALLQAVDQGAHIAVLVDHDGHLIDGSQATVWLRFEDGLLTPPTPPAVAGVSRAVVLESARSVGYTAEEAVLTAEDFAGADEVIFTTALAGAVGARHKTGPAAESLKRLFDTLFTG
ncbi:MAG: aminotransferase class IV [Coriobacteriia bacterium]|nr:aminotransferase class IV [Coriobacteriia bacterium]